MIPKHAKADERDMEDRLEYLEAIQVLRGDTQEESDQDAESIVHLRGAR